MPLLDEGARPLARENHFGLLLRVQSGQPDQRPHALHAMTYVTHEFRGHGRVRVQAGCVGSHASSVGCRKGGTLQIRPGVATLLRRLCLSACLSVSLFLSVCLSVYLSICLSVCLFVCLSVCLSLLFFFFLFFFFFSLLLFSFCPDRRCGCSGFHVKAAAQGDMLISTVL